MPTSGQTLHPNRPGEKNTRAPRFAGVLISFPNGRKRLAAESKKCPMNSQQLAFRSVIDEARVLEPLHEEANARPRGPYHFCQRFMTDLRNCCLACSTPIKMGHSEENMGQSFLAGITALVN